MDALTRRGVGPQLGVLSVDRSATLDMNSTVEGRVRYNATLGGKQPEVRHVHRKVFLPTYGVFDEERFVDRGQGIQAFDTAFGVRAAILICEDAWHSLSATIA